MNIYVYIYIYTYIPFWQVRGAQHRRRARQSYYPRPSDPPADPPATHQPEKILKSQL